jgi:hypothetical protein
MSKKVSYMCRKCGAHNETCGCPADPPKIRMIGLYDDGSGDVMLLDEGQDIDALLKEWVKLDDQMCQERDKEPEDWKPFSEWMESKGVRIVSFAIENINNFREDQP